MTLKLCFTAHSCPRYYSRMIRHNALYSFWLCFALWLGLGVPLVSMINQLSHIAPHTSTAQTLKQLEPAQSDYDQTASVCGWHHCHCPLAHAPALPNSNQAEFLSVATHNAIPPFLPAFILELIPSELERPPKA